jgi:hypothetical protein
MPNTSRVVLVAALALAVALSAHSQGPTPGPGKRRNDQQAHARDTTKAPGHDQRGTVDSPFVVKLVPAQRDQGDLAREANERKEKAASDRKLVWWTAVLGVATIALAALTGTNLWLLWRQSGDLKQQQRLMQRQADHMEEQARQLKASVAQMKDTSDRQLRAYLTRSGPPTREELPPPYSPYGRAFFFRVPITNTGATPAYNVTVQGHAMLTDMNTPIESSMWRHSSHPESAATLGPGQKMEVGCVSDTIHDDLMEKLDGLELRVVMYGKVIYRDAFDEPPYVEFCEMVNWVTPPASASAHQVDTFPVGDYNKAD